MGTLARAVLIPRSTLVLVIDRPLAGCYALSGSSALSRSFVSSLALARRMAVQRPTAATIAPMPWHDRKPDPWYAIRTRKGAWGIVYRVSFTRHGKNVAKLFRARDYANARSVLKAARVEGTEVVVQESSRAGHAFASGLVRRADGAMMQPEP